MTYKTQYGEYNGCHFVTSRYADNGNLALCIENNEEGRIAICTVNPGMPLGDNQIAVKNYSENEGMDDFLKGEGLIGKLVGTIPSGWVNIPVYELTEKGRELFKVNKGE